MWFWIWIFYCCGVYGFLFCGLSFELFFCFETNACDLRTLEGLFLVSLVVLQAVLWHVAVFGC